MAPFELPGTIIILFLWSIAAENCRYPSHPAVAEPDLDSVGVEGGVCQDFLYNTPGQLPAPLVCLLDNIDRTARADIGPVFSRCHKVQYPFCL